MRKRSVSRIQIYSKFFVCGTNPRQLSSSEMQNEKKSVEKEQP